AGAGCERGVVDRAAGAVPGAKPLSIEEVVSRVDLMVVLGGDGTVLSTARAIGTRDVPIFAINLGWLGFLTDVGPEDMDDALAAVLTGEYRIAARSRLSVTRVHRA